MSKISSAAAPKDSEARTVSLPKATTVQAQHEVLFDWSYAPANAELANLHEHAVRSQWSASRDLPWATPVDPTDEEKAILPAEFVDAAALKEIGIHLSPAEHRRLRADVCSWMLSQFLHGEQGALYAAAQAVESAPGGGLKAMAATQVADESRHVAVFERYLREKLGRVYTITDNLFKVIESLLHDRHWDVKFLGMQIIVEGLALSAFGNMYKRSREPLLRELLRRVLEDEARHVRFGLLALRAVTDTLDARVRRSREDYAFEMARLMRDRFRAVEVYDEWFGHKLSRNQWSAVLAASAGMAEFQRILFGRLARHLTTIGLFSETMANRFAEEGLYDARRAVSHVSASQSTRGDEQSEGDVT